MKLTNFANIDYEPEDLDSETTITDEGLGLIEESIINQFEDPSGHAKTDIVSSFLTRYALTKTEIAYTADEEEIESAKNLHRRFVAFMEETFKEKLNIGIVDLEDMGENEQDTIIHYLYRFFIINISQNMFNYTYRYIKKNKTELSQILPNTKTVSIKRMSDLIDDKEMVVIAANLSDAVALALSDENITVTDFLDMCKSKDYDLEREYVIDRYDDFTITGNFVEKYHKLLPSWYVVELESTLLTKIVKKYKKAD